MTSINYPVDNMRLTARKIRDDATNHLQQHETHWSQVQACISPLPGFMQSSLNLVLSKYDQRLRQSFQAQMDYATWLEGAANTMNGLDQDVSKSFKGFSF